MLRIRRGGPSTRAQTALLGSLFLTIAYTVSGKLALLLAVAPGYASPIFPPAGIAVAAMLIAGRSTLPWTFLGSFLLNLWTGYLVGQGSGPMTVAAASAIAAASTLQAAIGGTVLRRTIGYPTALDNGRDLTRFLTLPPVFCLTSATLSLGGLFPLGLVRPSDLATNWVSWWIGDTLGVLVVLPLVLVMAGEPKSLWRGRAVPVALPMALFVALFVAIFVRVDEWEHDAALLEFRLLSQQIIDKIRTGLEEQDVFLEQLERSFTRPVALSAADFQHLVQHRLQQFPMTQAVEWAPRVDATARASFERAQRASLPGFEIREADPSGHLRPARPRAAYYPVTYVEPLRGNEEAVGFDLGSQYDRRAALERAMRTNRIAATAPIRLVQETAEQAGILLLYPVHSSVNGTGVLLVVHRMGTFLDGLLAPVRPMVEVRFIDLDANKVLYGGSSPAAIGAIYRTAFAFGGRDYGVETTPTPLYLERHRSWQSWVVLAAGVIGTGLLGGLLLLGTGYARRIETVVEQRTRDLAAVNDRLQREVKEREHAEAALHQAQKMERSASLPAASHTISTIF